MQEVTMKLNPGLPGKSSIQQGGGSFPANWT